MLHVGAAGKFRNYTAVFRMYGLVGDVIGQDLSVTANRGGGFIAGRLYGKDNGQGTKFAFMGKYSISNVQFSKFNEKLRCTGVCNQFLCIIPILIPKCREGRISRKISFL
jgi:hypothetical protein